MQTKTSRVGKIYESSKAQEEKKKLLIKILTHIHRLTNTSSSSCTFIVEKDWLWIPHDFIVPIFIICRCRFAFISLMFTCRIRFCFVLFCVFLQYFFPISVDVTLLYTYTLYLYYAMQQQYLCLVWFISLRCVSHHLFFSVR